MPDLKNANGSDSLWAAEARQLLDRAGRGDDTCLPELRQLLDKRPDVWRALGDLARHAELSLLRLVAGGNLLARETTRRRLEELKTELTGPEATPLERLLVDRITICWLQVHHLDLETAALPKAEASSPAGVGLEKLLAGAQRRYLQALKQLALVRKLLPHRLAPVEVCRRLGAGRSTLSQRSSAAPGKGVEVLN